MKFSQHLDAGGFIPVWLINKKLPKALGVVTELVNAFQRDDEVDRIGFTALSNIIKNETQVYTEKEKEAIKRGKVSEIKAR